MIHREPTYKQWKDAPRPRFIRTDEVLRIPPEWAVAIGLVLVGMIIAAAIF